jgi:hypothetical protein
VVGVICPTWSRREPGFEIRRATGLHDQAEPGDRERIQVDADPVEQVR